MYFSHVTLTKHYFICFTYKAFECFTTDEFEQTTICGCNCCSVALNQLKDSLV